MMPMIEEKSGMERTLLSRPAMMEPTTMPARAVPMGRPMASTEPNARISTMMAKARPSTSELGGSNSAKTWPPSSTWRPGTSGNGGLHLLREVGGLLDGEVARQTDAREGDRAVLGDLLGSLGAVRRRDAGDLVDRRHLGEELRHRLLHGRVGDALLGPEDDGAALAVTPLGEVGFHDVEATGALDVGQIELGAVALPDDAGQDDLRG